MASTRFRDDPARIEDQVRQSTFSCGYMINAPGNGVKPQYMEDPYVRIQKWGANFMTNSVNLESELKGIRPLNNDCLGKHEYSNYAVETQQIKYPDNSSMYTEQPRAVAPAWELRDEVCNRHGEPTLMNPQENVMLPFNNNVSTRILEKDNFNPKSLGLNPHDSTSLMPHHFPGNNNRS